jgi:hypothetical protein
VVAVAHSLAALGFAALDYLALAVAFALSGVMWAILSLKERT